MRLLHTSTFKLHDFQSHFTPYYAILSHRWGPEELSFQDLQEEDPRYVEKDGFVKVLRFCAYAASEGWQYIWIDTCCIDKSSSSELSESINSMYKWYEDAQVCYVYLSDVTERENHCAPESTFRKSKWFTRGWTLQELLAPSLVVFLNRDWIQIGTKSSLYDTIVSVTGVEPLDTFRSACVAQKMSWASRRQTTRVEDMAYCLMGLFGVNMTPLYGEGENAFKRLQLQILDQEDDESIFAWKDFLAGGGLLAHSPASFRHSGDVQRLSRELERKRPPFSMTNKGLRIELNLIPLEHVPLTSGSGTNGFLAPLNCNRQNSDDCLALFLVKDSNQNFQRVYHELGSCDRLEAEKTGQLQLVYVLQKMPRISHIQDQNGYRSFQVLIAFQAMRQNGYSIFKDILPYRHQSYGWLCNIFGAKGTFTMRDLPASLDAIVFENKNNDGFALLLGIDSHGRVGAEIAIQSQYQPLDEFVHSLHWDQKEKPLRLTSICKSIRPELWVSVTLGKQMVGRQCTFVVKVKMSPTEVVF